MYSLDLWTNCHAARAQEAHVWFSSDFCVPMAYVLCAEVCDPQICLFYHKEYFRLQNNTELCSPLN